MVETRPSGKDSGIGLGMRSPGAINPHTGTFSEILEHNIGELLDRLSSTPGGYPAAGFPKGEKEITEEKERITEESRRQASERSSETASAEAELEKEQKNREKIANSGHPEQPDKTSQSEESLVAASTLLPWMKAWLVMFRIDEPSSRHNLLCSLAGHIFHQVGKSVGRQIVQHQYAEKTVSTRASASEHETEFKDLWTRLERRWLAELTPVEADAFKKLRIEAKRETFKIIRSYQRLASEQGTTDFPIARDNLAARLGVTPQYAGQIRAEFVSRKIIQLTKATKPHKAAACYSWLLTDGAEIPTVATGAITSEFLDRRTTATPNAAGEQLRAPTVKNDSTSSPLRPAGAESAPEAPNCVGNTEPSADTDKPTTGPLAMEKRIYHSLLVQGPSSCAELESKLAMPASSLATALQRLEASLCIHQLGGQYAIGCEPSANVVRKALEFLTKAASTSKRVDVTDSDLQLSAGCRRPPLSEQDLERAFQIAVDVGILANDGTRGRFLGLGTPLPRPKIAPKPSEASLSQLAEPANEKRQWLEHYVRQFGNR